MPKKDFWDRLGSVSSILGGVLVAAFGFYATHVYDRSSKAAEDANRLRNTTAMELQTLEKFLPHLSSGNERVQQAAILAISSLGTPELAARVAQIFRGEGSRAAITQIAPSLPAEVASAALYNLFRDLSPSVMRISVTAAGSVDATAEVTGTAFVVSESGYALTAAYLFPEGRRAEDLRIVAISAGGARAEVRHIMIDRSNGFALIRLPSTSGQSYSPLRLEPTIPAPGRPIAIMGYPVDAVLGISQGTVVSNASADGSLRVNSSLGPGSGGGPIFDSGGAVVAMVLGRHVESHLTVAAPIVRARTMLEQIGVPFNVTSANRP